MFSYSVIFQGIPWQAGNRRYLQSRYHIHHSVVEQYLYERHPHPHCNYAYEAHCK